MMLSFCWNLSSQNQRRMIGLAALHMVRFIYILDLFISLMVLANVEMCKEIVLSVQKHCDGCSKDIMISVLH